MPYSAFSLRQAACNGRVDTIEWMCSTYGVKPTCETFAAAVEGGSLPVLTWLLEHDCPWGARTCAQAAWMGNLKVLKWLRENGCPWDHRTREMAMMRSKQEVLTWANDNGCPGS